ncbi:putative MO25-like protein [Tanacetum coccineum]|uniref:MO25-like protein n=1 Tax=Tanacetum coccineum TaxID=301880 RepID=A0ABQ5CS78_9ASTR
MLGITLEYLRMDVYRSVWVVEKLIWIFFGTLVDAARKDATQIVANLQRQQVHSRLIACDYLEANINLMDILASEYILESQHMKKFFDFIQLPNFDIAADAAATFKYSAEARLGTALNSRLCGKEAVVKTHSMTPINETSKLLQDNEVREPKDDIVQKHSSQVRESKDDIVQKHSSQVRELKDDVVQNHGSHAKLYCNETELFSLPPPPLYCNENECCLLILVRYTARSK